MSRLAIELKTGVFVGNLNARVREELWEKICVKWNSNALMIYTTNTEQGFGIRSNGDPSRAIFECEGINLMERIQKKPKSN
jgi:CRISPR-associated protein Cas2